jgi:hypothetical protein
MNDDNTATNIGTVTLDDNDISVNHNGYYDSTIYADNITSTVSNIDYGSSSEMSIGNNNNSASSTKIYIVEEWQSKKPIKMDNGLTISLEKDLINYDDIKKKVMNKLSEVHPDLVVRMGINHENIKLMKSEVNLEINKGT